MTRLALVSAGDAEGGAATARLRVLLPVLEEFAELEVFIGVSEQGASPADFAGRPAGRHDSLRPRAFDQVLYFLEDTPSHAFMLPMIRDVGGVVVLHDWNLGRLALAARPALGRDGLPGQLAAWREGGLRAFLEHRRHGARSALEALPLNRSVVRQADAFVVPHADWRRWILDERNAPTPVAVVPWDRGHAGGDIEATGPRFRECLELLPTHRTNRKSLIRTAIEESDRAR
jgi:hypothetical protein